MGHTNETANVLLSQFLGSDKPAWLVDYNGDMAKIDAYAYATKVKADANESAITSLGNRVTTVENNITNTITPALTAAQNNITTLQGNITTINSLIGNGTPTTTDQTIIGAINEINGEIPHNKITVVADGVMTFADALKEIFDGVDDLSKIDPNAYIKHVTGANEFTKFTVRKVDSTSIEVYNGRVTGSDLRVAAMVASSTLASCSYSQAKIDGNGLTITPYTTDPLTGSLVFVY